VWSGALCAPEIKGFCFDARQVRPGDCFVALRGSARDGHEFIEQANQGGAVAALVEVISDAELPQLLVADTLLALGQIGAQVRQAFSPPVVGVTGSSGKTSTKEMLRILLGGDGLVHATAGNWNNRIGVPMTLLQLDAQRQDFAVIEAGINQPGEMELLGAMIRGDLTVVTNIGPAHLELLGNLEGVASEKARLAQTAVEQSPIILPREVLDFGAFAVLAQRAIVLIESGQNCELNVRNAVSYRLQATGGGTTVLELGAGPEVQQYTIASPSQGIARNAGLAILAARELGIAEAAIKARIEAWRPVGSRGRVETRGAQRFYIDCYNANPASMRDALQAFRSMLAPELPRIYVLGAMNELGAQAAHWHASVAAGLQLRPIDRVYFIGPQALTRAYAAGALQGGAQPDQIQRMENHGNLKSEIAEMAGALFFKGSRAYALEQLLPFPL
jgi:UDP-N-acetylmuramoyl-tripeptide--D-alanyl-D-alanine ligase